MPNITSHTSQLIEPTRIDIGKMLIAHELDKLFPGLDDYDHIKAVVNKRWNNLDGEVAIRNFWNLIDSTMMGYELKDIVRLITSEKVSWKLEEKYPVDQLRFGWGEKVGNFELNGKTAKEVTDYLEKHKDVLENLKKRYQKKLPRANDPIIVERYSGNDDLHVHDGNGRLLRAIAVGQQTLNAYIGTQVQAQKSNHWVPTSFLQRLSDFLAIDTLIRVLRESDNAVFEFEDRVVTDFKQKVLEAL